MDWDGIGTFAMFLSTGAVGLGVVALRAYKARLTAKVEVARIEADPGPNLDLEQIHDLEVKLARLSERLDFNEKLLSDGHDDTPDGT